VALACTRRPLHHQDLLGVVAADNGALGGGEAIRLLRLRGEVIMALPWYGGRTRAPCSPALAEGGPVPLPGGEDSGGPGRGLERPPGVGEEPARHLPPTPAPRPGVETGTAHTPLSRRARAVPLADNTFKWLRVLQFPLTSCSI